MEIFSFISLGQTSYLKTGKSAIIRHIPKCSKYHEELDLEFCARYGHEDYSLQAINYTRPLSCELPSLIPFLKEEIFSIGNIIIGLGNGDYDIEISLQEGINLVGYSYDISSRKKKSYLCLFGIWFEQDIIKSILQDYLRNCKHELSNLDEIQIGTNSYPIIYICRLCGQIFTCSCFETYFDIQDDLMRRLTYRNNESELREYIEKIQIKNNICHLCTGEIPKIEYGHHMYYSSFMQRYLPYHQLFSRRRYGCSIYNGELSKEIENELREVLNYPKIGEKWISENMLYKIVGTLLPQKQIIHHYRGNELEGLELDIWIPDLKLGIEYQGKQHYVAVEHWGGEEGFKKRTEYDKKKRKLCEELGYSLIEFTYSESLTEDNVRRKLNRFIN